MAYQTNTLQPQTIQKPDMFRDFTDGIISYGKAYRLMAKHKLWYYIVVPGIASVILGLSIVYSVYLLSDNVTALLTMVYPKTWWGASIVANIAAVFSWIILGTTTLSRYSASSKQPPSVTNGNL